MFVSNSDVCGARFKAIKYLLNIVSLCCNLVDDSELLTASEHNLLCSWFRLRMNVFNCSRAVTRKLNFKNNQ